MRYVLSVLFIPLTLLAFAEVSVARGDVADSSGAEEVVVLRKNMAALQEQLVAAREAVQQDEKLKMQVELLQKQIEVQQKMIDLLLEHAKKQPIPGSVTEKLQGQVATLEARSKQAAVRDQELAEGINNVVEHADAQERAGPRLPSTLKELFLPSETNESPLSIYGQLVFGYHQFNGTAGQFESPDFSPYFLLKLNDQFFLEANIDITRAGVDVPEAQIDWLVNDWLTVVGGRYLTPIGFFNERLNHEWINKLPDPPLMFGQIAPLISTDGLQLRGAFYLGCCPVKVEYSLYGGNGVELGAAPTTYSQAVDFVGIAGGPDEVAAKAIGGRIGIVVPEWGFWAGVSGYYNGSYAPGFPDHFQLWDFDLNYHKGNWDARFEFARTNQQALSFIGNDVTRTGLYAQIAYRPYDAPWRILQNFEAVFRYSVEWFSGIDPTQIDPAAFDSLVDVPVNRDQYTVGLNYYFYPSMVLKCAYEVNHERGDVNLHDNVFLAQFAWSF
jgi:hypothetical protein